MASLGWRGLSTVISLIFIMIFKNRSVMLMLYVTQDSSIADAKVVIDLIDAIKPGTINYELEKEGGTDEVSSVFLWYMVNNEFNQFARHFHILHLS
jgi:hypothetical protein